MRWITALTLVMLLSLAARADVVILNENDVPLNGRILAETATSITFQVRGLGESSKFEIEKSRIRRFWREENAFFEYQKSERDRQGTIERLRPEPAAAAREVKPVPPPRSRTAAEIRRQLFDKAVDRARSVLPTSLPLRILALLASMVFLALLLRTGGRVAGLSKLLLPQAVVLSFITHLLIVMAIAGPKTILDPDYLPVLLTAEVVAWLIIVRLLVGEVLSRAFLLLSFCIASLLLLGGSVFSVLSVL